MQEQTNPILIWLSDKQVAERYAIKRNSVWRWARTGILPQPHKIGPNTTRWRVTELDQFDQKVA